jgi:hypothetical protein
MPDWDHLDRRNLKFELEARSDFDNALMKAFWREVLSWFLQRKNTLEPFEQVRSALPVKGQHWIGIQVVPLNKIVGSVGRYRDFDTAFEPRQTRTRGRWMSVDVAHLKDINLPPVELYKIGDIYFVKDGNHRVSVAHQKNQVFIDAEVIEIDVDVPVTRQTDLQKLILGLEKAAFLEKTHLDKVRPGVPLELTLTGQYAKLLEHIDVHRWYLGEQHNQDVGYEEALASWVDTVYLPLVEIIHQKGILKDFPKRTEADLYLWIIEHHWFLASAGQDKLSMVDAALHYQKKYSQRMVRKMFDFIRKAARVVTEGVEAGFEETATDQPSKPDGPENASLNTGDSIE